MECPECGHKYARSDRTYSHLHDAYYCPLCKTWGEPKCDEPDCEYCIDRPPTAEGEKYTTC